MATRDLSVRFTTSGFEDLRRNLAAAGKSFDEALNKAKQASQEAIADAKKAAGDTDALAKAQKAFENAARQANNAVAGSFRELRIKSTADIEAQKTAAVSAYEAIEKSGTASAQDIANAKAALIRTLKSLDDQLDQTGDKVNKLGEGWTLMKGVLANLISSGIQAGLSAIANTIQSLTQGIIGFGNAVFQSGSQTETLKAQLKTIEGTAAGAQKAYEQIAQFAKTTPYELTEVTQAYISLANRGLKVTNAELQKIGDLAASQGKPLQQYVEAILDAMSGENERLKEFGIQASKNGEKVAFTFRGMTKEVGKSGDEILKALLSFSEVDGVLGGMEERSKTTQGQMSNIADALDQIYVKIFEAVKPAIESVLKVVSDILTPLGEQKSLFTGLGEVAAQFVDFLKASPEIVESLKLALSDVVAGVLLTATELAGQLLDFLKENPQAIADLIRQTASFAGGVLRGTVNLAQALLNYFNQNREQVAAIGLALQGAGKFMQGFLDLVLKSAEGWGKILYYAKEVFGLGKQPIESSRDMISRAYGAKGVSALQAEYDRLEREELKKHWFSINSPLGTLKGDAAQRIADQAYVNVAGNPKAFGLTPIQQGNSTGGGKFIGTFGQNTVMSMASQYGLKAHSGEGNHFGSNRTWGNAASNHRAGNAVDFGDNMQGVSKDEAHKKFSSLVNELIQNGTVTHVDEIIWNGKGSPLGDYFATGGKGPFFKIANGKKVPLTNLDVVRGHTDHLHMAEKTKGGDAYSVQSAIAGSAMTSGGGAAPLLTQQEMEDLIQMMAAEATGEGVIGKAAVGRAILNRSALIASGVAPKGTGGYGAKSASVSDVIRGKNARGNWEFSPMGDGRFNKQYDAKVMAEARQAFNMLLDDNALKALGLSDATINSPNFQNVALRKPGWWQGQSTQVKQHHFGRDKFSATRNVSELVAKTFTTESGVSPATTVAFSGAGVNPMPTMGESDAVKAENELEKQREQARQNALKRRDKQQQMADQEAIAVLKDQHEIRLEELKREQVSEFDVRQEQSRQTLELRRLETKQAIAQLKRERADIEKERAKKLKTPVAEQTSEQKVANYSDEIKTVDWQIQQQEKSLKRTTDKITREFAYIAEDRAKSETQKQIDEYVELGNARINTESLALDKAQANQEITQTELTYRRAVLEASRKQLEIDRLSQQLSEELIKPDDVEPTKRKIEALKQELTTNKEIAEINYKRAQIEQESQSKAQLTQFDLDTQKRRLDIAEQTGQISKENLIIERANLEIAGKQLEQQQAIAALKAGVPPEQKQTLELRIQTINDEIEQTKILTEFQLEQIDIQKQQLSYQADYEQVSRLIQIAERQGNFEKVESLKLLQAQFDLENKIAEIKQKGLRPDQEAQAIAAETQLYELNKEEIINGNRNIGESLREMLNGPWSEFFQTAIDGTKSLSDAFNAMAQSVLSSLGRIGAEMATNSLMNMLGLGKPQQMQGLGGAIAGLMGGQSEPVNLATVGGGMFGDGVGLAESAVAGFSGIVPANNLAFAPSAINSPQPFTGMVQPAIAIASEEVTQALSTLTQTTTDTSNNLTDSFTKAILDSTVSQTTSTTEFVSSLQIARNAVISFAQSLPGGSTGAGDGGGILGTLAKGAIGAIGGASLGGFTAANASAGLSTANAVASGSFGGFATLPTFKYGGEVEKLSTVQTFKEGGEVKEIATYKNGGMVEKLLPVPTFANGGKVDPLRTAIASAFKKEGSGAMLAVMHSGEHVLSDRQGEAQTYRTLEKHFGKNPLAKIPMPMFMDGGAVGSMESRLLSGLNSSRMPALSLPTQKNPATAIAGPVSNSVTVNINDRESRFYKQAPTIAREMANKLRG